MEMMTMAATSGDKGQSESGKPEEDEKRERHHRRRADHADIDGDRVSGDGHAARSEQGEGQPGDHTHDDAGQGHHDGRDRAPGELSEQKFQAMAAEDPRGRPSLLRHRRLPGALPPREDQGTTGEPLLLQAVQVAVLALVQ